jgi:hypothetical protein
LVQSLRGQLGQGAVGQQSTRARLFRVHSSLYNELSPEERGAFERQARALAAQQELEMQREVEAEETREALRRDRLLAARETEGLPTKNEAFKLGDVELISLGDNVASAKWTTAELARRRAAALKPLEGPTARQLQLLASCYTEPPTMLAAGVAAPEWLRVLSAHRYHFKAFVFARSLGHGAQGALFLYATQQPMEVWFLALERVATALPALRAVTVDDAVDMALCVHRHQYRVVDSVYWASRDLPFAGDLLAIPDMAFDGASLISDSVARPLAEVLGELPPLPAPRAPARAGPRAAPAPDPSAADLAALIAERPYLAEYLNDASQVPSTSGAAAGASSDASAGPCGDVGEVRDHLLPEELERVWSDLAQLRERYEAGTSADDDFQIKVRGGVWTETHRGSAADCVVGQAVGAARAWARRYSMNIMASFAFGKYDQEAVFLATAWCKKNQALYNRWVGAGGGDYVYTEEDLMAAETDPDYQAVLIMAVEPGGDVAERAEAIRALRPINP